MKEMDLVAELEKIVADANARPATRVAAAKELARLRELQSPGRDDPLGQMRAVVEKYARKSRVWRGRTPIPCATLTFGP